jgi:hypothetical protein
MLVPMRQTGVGGKLEVAQASSVITLLLRRSGKVP